MKMKIFKLHKNMKLIRSYLLVFCIVLLFLFSTVVYSAISSTMTVSGDAYARVEADVRITNFSIYETSSDVISSYEEYNKDTIASNINLPNTDSYIIYRVEVTNYSSIPAGIASITNNGDSLSYELVDYSLKDMLCDEYDNCTTMSKKIFYIKFSGSTAGTYNINLSFTFKIFHPVTYDGITNNGYPTYVMDKEPLSIAFTEVLTGKVGLKMNNEFVYYTFNDNVLTLDSVTGPVNLYMETNLFNIVRLGSSMEGIPSTHGDYTQYFYAKETTDNNILFANKCWKGVRTTDAGGVKLIYSGLPGEDGSCQNTEEATFAGKSVFMSIEDLAVDHPELNIDLSNVQVDEELLKYVLSYSAAGYMYGEGYLTLPKELDIEVSMSMSSWSYSVSENYFYGDSVVYENNTYTLQNAVQYELTDNYESVKGYYTCRSTTNNTCSTVYYIYDVSGTTQYVFQFSSGKTFENDLYTVFESENSDVPIFINRLDWYKNYSNYVGYYACEDMRSSDCDEVYKIYDTSNTWSYLSTGKGLVYGNDVKYENGVYTLIDTYQSGYWYDDYINIGNAHHYTCFTNSNSCEIVFYISGYADSGASYVTLKNGDNIDIAKKNMEKNTYDSTLKKFMDNWYENNMTDYTNMLEDTPWCIDKEIRFGPLAGKDFNIKLFPEDEDSSIPVNIFGDLSWYVDFMLYLETEIPEDATDDEIMEIVMSKIDFRCSNSRIQDQFSVSTINGNGLSKYPVSLLTIKELLIGGYDSNDSFLSSDSSYFDTPTGIFPLVDEVPIPFMLSMNGIYIPYAMEEEDPIGVRPVVTVKVGAEVVEGNGTGINPFKLNESVLGNTGEK